MKLPDEVDWWIHRILVSEHYKLGFTDLEMLSIDDVFDCHCVLDAIEAQQSFANRKH